MFDLADPKSQLALLCLITAFVFWDKDLVFFMFAIMALCTRLA